MKTMISVVTLSVALLLAGTSNLCARLGETEAECAARYGKTSEGTPNKFGEKMNMYSAGGMLINVTFVNGRAECIAFEKAPPADWPEEEIELLLRANAQGKEWHRIEPWGDWPLRWSRTDNARARYRGRRPFHDMLVIETDAYVQLQTKKENPALQKF